MLSGEPWIYHQGPRPPLVQLAPVLAPVHPPAVQVKYNDIPLENHKDTAYIGCIFVFLLLLSAKLDGPEKDWAKMVQEAMPPGSKACLIREEPHYLKTQARSPIFWRTSGLSSCAIISLMDRIILAIKELLKKTLRFVIVNVILKLLII